MYLFLSGTDSIRIFPSNTHTDFVSVLPRSIPLDGDWEVCLTHAYDKNRRRGAYVVYTDICSTSCIKATERQVLGTFSEPGDLSSHIYIPVNVTNLERIRITVENLANTRSDINDWVLFVLHLRKCTTFVR